MIETVTVLTDDLDKKTKTNVETVTFAIDGTSYEMELGSVNQRRLRETLQPYIEHGRRVTIQANGQQRKRGQAPKDESARIRAWAATQPDITLHARGRVPQSVRERFRAATRN
jgi:hypothetical protein